MDSLSHDPQRLDELPRVGYPHPSQVEWSQQLCQTNLWRQIVLAILGQYGLLTFLGVPIGMVAALATALSLNVKTPLTTIFRTLFFLPSQIPGVANAVLWALIFNAQFGILNQLLGNLGIEPINWLFNKNTVKPALIFMGLWGVGGSMMIYLAGLQGIPQELYEAAEIDGANLWRRMLACHSTLAHASDLFLADHGDYR